MEIELSVLPSDLVVGSGEEFMQDASEMSRLSVLCMRVVRVLWSCMSEGASIKESVEIVDGVGYGNGVSVAILYKPDRRREEVASD